MWQIGVATQVIRLRQNLLGNRTAAAFGELLGSNHSLRELDLSWNLIKVRSAVHAVLLMLCSKLARSHSLWELNLS